MTTETETTPEVLDSLPLPEHIAEVTRWIAVQTRLKKAIDKERPRLLKRMLEEKKRTGGRSFVHEWDEESAVTLTPRGNGAKVVVDDEDVLLGWVEENAPSEVKTEFTVQDAYKKSLLERKAVLADHDAAIDPKADTVIPGAVATEDGLVVSVDGEVLSAAVPAPPGTLVHKDTGKVIRGLKYVPAGEPDSFGTSWKGNAQSLALGELLSGGADQLLGIEGGDQQ